MSKLYAINRMTYGAAAGDPFLGSIAKAAGKFLGGLFRKKSVTKIVQVAQQLPKGKAFQVIAPAVAGGVAWAGAEKLMSGGGASGSWGPRRRRRGITAMELRGYRKVANLIHKEGMVSRRARGRR